MQVSIEVKNPTGRNRLTPSQKELVKQGWLLHVVRTVGDAFDVTREHMKQFHNGRRDT